MTEPFSLPCFCGHDCARCVTYLASRRDEDGLRRRAQAFYREAFGLAIPLAECRCGGGRSQEVFALCRECPFALCCRERGIDSCAACPEYPCPQLAAYQEKLCQPVQSGRAPGALKLFPIKIKTAKRRRALCTARGGVLYGKQISESARPQSMARDLSCSTAFAAKSATAIAPRSPSLRPRTETVPVSASLSPTTSIYGVFCSCASRIL